MVVARTFQNRTVGTSGIVSPVCRLQASHAVEDLQKNLEEETVIVEEKKQATQVNVLCRRA